MNSKRWLGPILKGTLALVILVFVGRQFVRDLSSPALAQVEFHGVWLASSAAIYLVGLSFSALFWLRLLRIFGERPALLSVLRAYYVGHLGKYVPGKAWALLLRAGLARAGGVNFGTAVLTSFYEVLTTMAAGALLAAIVFVIDPPQTENLRWHPLFTGLLLLGLLAVPLLPGVFNLLTSRLARRIPTMGSLQAPKMSLRILAEGILTTGLGWVMLGLSVWAALAAVLPDLPRLTPGLWAQLIGIIGLGYVAGFLALVVPGGVGVREYFLLHLLSFAGPEPQIALAVLLMRLAWTAAELLAAGVFYFIRAIGVIRG